MSLISRRLRLLAWLLPLLLILLWFALPSLLGKVVLHVLDMPGVSGLEVNVASVGPAHVSLRSLKSSYQGEAGDLARIELHDIDIDFSLPRRQIDLIHVGTARIEYAQGNKPSQGEWPVLDWPRQPWMELRVDKLQLSARMQKLGVLETLSRLQARQDDSGRIQALLTQVPGELQLVFQPGAQASLDATWRPAGLAEDVTNLYVTYAIGTAANQAEYARVPKLSVKGEIPAAVVVNLLADRGWNLSQASGRLDLQAELSLGPVVGEFDAMHASLQGHDVQLEQLASGQRLKLSFSGPLALDLEEQGEKISLFLTLLPELAWQASSVSGQDWQASSRLVQPMRITLDGKPGNGDMPIALKTGKFGNWQLMLSRPRLALGPGDRPSVGAHIGLAGQTSRWQQDKLIADRATVSGQAELEWRPVSGTPLQGLAGNAQLAIAAVKLAYGDEAELSAPQARLGLQLAEGRLTGKGTISLQGHDMLGVSGNFGPRSCGQLVLDMDQPLAEIDGRLRPRPRRLRPLMLRNGQLQSHLDLRSCLQPELNWTGNGRLRLKNASLAWDKASADGVDLDLDLSRLMPLSGRLSLQMADASIATGTELAKTRLDLELDEKSLKLDQMQAFLLGGELNAEPTSLPRPPSGQALPIRLKGIDLAKVLALVDVAGLSGSGRLEGSLPMAWTAQGLEIRAGRLQSQAGGQIRYLPSASVPDNPGLQALRNFHYQQLELLLDYAADGGYKMRILLEGSNPDFYSGHPIRFSLDIKGALPGLMRSALLSGDFERYILEQFEAGKLQ